jgi:uncharacterized protein involved in exopolysaccharide biosynthesis
MESQFQPQTDVEIDFGQLMRTLRRRLPYLIVFIVLVAAGVWLVLGRIAPIYKSETTLLVQGADASLAGTGQTDTTALDAQAITSQVQIIKSRDLAQAVAEKLDLASKPEFDPKAAHPSLVNSLLQKVGLAKPPSTPNVPDHVLDVYFANLSVYAIENSRVIAIDFASTNPQLAADVANAIADEYLSRQSAAKRDTSAGAAQWLSDQIVDLRGKVQNAEAAVEDFRSKNNLFDTGGSTPTTLTQQQLNDLNTQLTQMRATRTASEAKAAQIRAALQSNGIPSITDVLNSPLIQNLVEQEVGLKGQIAQLSATLLPGHPRMRELNAQVAGLDQQIGAEAQKILDSVEADVSLDKSQEAQLQQQLEAAKQTTATQNDASVQLRALEREASADRDLLETYLARYREAVSREQGPNLPADARVISRAAVAASPDFPKKVPLTAAATMAALILAIAFILLRELASGRPMRRIAFASDSDAADEPTRMPAESAAEPPISADEPSVHRTPPKEPTLVPEVVDRVEESLRTIASRVLESGQKRILVTLAEGSDSDGRPLGAVALARALARKDARVVLVDFRGDGADATSMGEGADVAGFSDLFEGDVSFAQVIFRDHKSRVHFIPAGRHPLSADGIDRDSMETILSALTLTYDYVVLDAADDLIRLVAPGCGMAVVVSEHPSGDPRTAAAFDRVTDIIDANVLLLLVDPVIPAHAAA